MALEIGKKIAKWTIILTGLDYVVLVLTFVFSLLIIANLQPANYGLFSIASATYLVLSSILQSFFVTPFIRAVSQHLGKNDFTAISHIYGFAVIMVLIGSSIIALIHFGVSSFIATYILGYPEIVIYMELLSVNIVSLLISALFSGLLLSLKSYRKLALYRFTDGVFYIVGISITVLIHNWTVIAIVLGTDLYLFLSCLFAILLAITETRKRKIQFKVSFSKALFQETFGLGKYFSVGNSLHYIFQRWDIFVVSIMVHNSLLIGYYAFAKNLVYRIRLAFAKLNTLLYPIFSEQEATSDISVMNKLLKAGNIISFILIVPLSFFVALFTREGIIMSTIIIENMISYLDASHVLSIFSLILIPYAVNSTIVSYFNGIGEVDKLVIANSILLAVSFVLLPILTLYLGIVGAAMAFTISLYLRTIYWIIITHRRVGLNFRRYLYALVSSIFSIFAIDALYTFLEQILFTLGIAEVFISLLVIPLSIVYGLLTYILLVKTKVITTYEMSLLDRATGKNKLAKKILNIIKKIGFKDMKSS